MLGLGIFSTTKKAKTAPKAKSLSLKRGKFYWHRDSSRAGQHPSRIYKKNEKKHKYYAVCFTHIPRKGRIKLNKNINPKDTGACYVLKQPTIDTSYMFGHKIKGYKITDKTDKAIVRNIQKKK